MKQVQITVPYEKTEAVLNFLLDGLNIKNVMKFNADNAIVLQFRIPDDSVNETIEGLKSRGVGVEFGFIDILDLKASLPRETEEAVNDTKLQREATLAVEEIYENVDEMYKNILTENTQDIIYVYEPSFSSERLITQQGLFLIPSNIEKTLDDIMLEDYPYANDDMLKIIK